jgi:hypothetical protein
VDDEPWSFSDDLAGSRDLACEPAAPLFASFLADSVGGIEEDRGDIGVPAPRLGQVE